MYNIYTYNPLQPTIRISNYTANFNGPNVGIKTVTINVNTIKDTTNNTNYAFVIPYTKSADVISNLSNYINKYTTLKSIKKITVKKTGGNTFAIIYINKYVFVAEI
jgi:hypothetical protein